jgi:flagellar basal body P-ring formation protein FlgA
MKFLLTFLLLASPSFAYFLKSNYSYDSSILYASDFFPDISDDFEVITMPDHLEHFSIAQKRLFRIFAEHNIILKGKPQGLVRFERFSDVDLSDLKDKLRAYYMKHIPYLIIKRIEIRSTRHISTLPSKYEVQFKKQLFKHHKGSFKIISDKERIFFNFIIHADFSMLQAKKTLTKGDIINFDNTVTALVPFKRFYPSLVSVTELGAIQSKRYIKAGKPLLSKDVTSLALVTKGSIVNIKLIEGNISIDFTATALKDARLYESIYVKKKDGSKIKVKVIGKNRAIIE